jgi:3-dehydrosphinganine reductase
MPKGITVGVCFPPDTDTPQFSRELESRPKEAELLMGRIKPRQAQEIAERLVSGIDRRSAHVYFTASISALALFGPLARPFVEIWYRLKLGR